MKILSVLLLTINILFGEMFQTSVEQVKTEEDLQRMITKTIREGYESLPEKTKKYITKEEYTKQKVEEFIREYVLSISDGTKKDTFEKYIKMKKQDINNLSKREYYIAVYFSKSLPQETIIKKIEEEIRENNIENNRKNTNILFNKIEEGKLTYGEKIYANVLLGLLLKNEYINEKTIKKIKGIVPNLNEVTNGEVVSSYFSIFTRIKDPKPFKKFMLTSVFESTDPMLKTLIIINLKEVHRKHKIFTEKEIVELNNILKEIYKDIKVEDYRKKYMLEYEVQQFKDMIGRDFLN